MRIKKFIDDDMIRLMRRVKNELGSEAVIVSTCQLDDGRSELVAAVESDEIDFENGDEAEVYSARYKDTFIRERLGYHEMSEATKMHLLAMCRQKAEIIGTTDDTQILTAVFEELFPIYDLLDANMPIKVFVGTSGSGKTTALAKTAAMARFRGISTAIISTDNVRAGANNQLQSLAAVMQTEFYVVKEVSQLSSTIAKLQKTCKLILIDTPGSNPFVSKDRESLSTILQNCNGEIILTMDAGYNANDAVEAAISFATCGAVCLLPTRLDLCRRIGGFLSAALEGKFKLGYASVSGSIAHGLAPIDNPSLARLLLA